MRKTAIGFLKRPAARSVAAAEPGEGSNDGGDGSRKLPQNVDELRGCVNYVGETGDPGHDLVDEVAFENGGA